MRADITKEQIESALADMFHGMDVSLTYEELRSRILSGYAYSIESSGQRKLVLNTGKGGALLYIDACEENGLPACVVANSITCYTDDGPYTMTHLKVKHVDNQGEDRAA
jgi:hypothetical protein